MMDIIQSFRLKVPERLGQENRLRLQVEREDEETTAGFVAKTQYLLLDESPKRQVPPLSLPPKTETDPVPKMLSIFSQR